MLGRSGFSETRVRDSHQRSRGGKGHFHSSSRHGNSEGGPGRGHEEPRGLDLSVGVRFERELGKNSHCFPLAQPSGSRAALKGERERLRTETAGDRVKGQRVSHCPLD